MQSKLSLDMMGTIILAAAALTSILISAIAVFVGLHVCIVTVHSGSPLRFTIRRELDN